MNVASRKAAESHWKGILLAVNTTSDSAADTEELSASPALHLLLWDRSVGGCEGPLARNQDPETQKNVSEFKSPCEAGTNWRAATSEAAAAGLRCNGATCQEALPLHSHTHTHWELFLLKHTLATALCGNRFISRETNFFIAMRICPPVQENSRHF